jgi:putative SOS response-associated peptidase YedK
LKEALLLQPARPSFDYAEWPVIKPSADGKDWDVVAMEWGFIPSNVRNRDAVNKFRNGYKDANGKFQIGYTTLNAMGEEILNKLMFREAALKRRCLVLSSGFYEHRHVTVIGKKGSPLKTPAKFPYHITVKDKPTFLIAGIYNTWTYQDSGETVDTFAIVTTKANSLMAQVHNSKMRMQTILSDDLANEWADPDLSPERIKEIATSQFSADCMEAYTVSKDFLNAVNPAEPFIYETLEALA